MPKITITGPESTGKSYLAAELLKAFGGGLVLEYAREYLSDLNRDYVQADLQKMAAEQLQREQLASAEHNLVFCDTDLLTFIIWWEVKFGATPREIEQLWLQNLPDLYLLPDIDLPWEDDPLREHPEFRDQLKVEYIQRLNQSGVAYHIVTGDLETRTSQAKTIVSKTLNKS